MPKVLPVARTFINRWRTVEISTCDNGRLDLIEEANVGLEGTSDGEIAAGALKGFLGVRYGSRGGSVYAELSWHALDDNDPTSGRGWATLDTAGRLFGQLYIHGGDPGFVRERTCVIQPASSPFLAASLEDMDLHQCR